VSSNDGIVDDLKMSGNYLIEAVALSIYFKHKIVTLRQWNCSHQMCYSYKAIITVYKYYKLLYPSVHFSLHNTYILMTVHLTNFHGNINPCALQQICEARANEGNVHLVEQNRGEFESILGRAMQPPPQKVCASSVYIEHVIRYVLTVVRSYDSLVSIVAWAARISALIPSKGTRFFSALQC
jgi:hypothetical protein